MPLLFHMAVSHSPKVAWCIFRSKASFQYSSFVKVSIEVPFLALLLSCHSGDQNRNSFCHTINSLLEKSN